MQRLPSFRPRGRSLSQNGRGSCCACGGLEKSDLRMDEDDAEEAAAGSTVKRSPVANALPAAENVAGTNTNDASPNAGETVHAGQQEMVATEAPTLTGVEGIISDAVKRQPAVDVPMDDAEKTAIGRGMKTSQAPRIWSRKSRRQRRALSECDGPQSMRMQPWMTKRQPSHPRDSIPRSSTGASESVQAQCRSQHRAESEQMGARQRGAEGVVKEDVKGNRQRSGDCDINFDGVDAPHFRLKCVPACTSQARTFGYCIRNKMIPPERDASYVMSTRSSGSSNAREREPRRELSRLLVISDEMLREPLPQLAPPPLLEGNRSQDSIFCKGATKAVFGAVNLQRRSVTGQPCRRLKRAAPKRALAPDKLAAMGTVHHADILGREQTWRSWADDVLVHILSPNVYRTRQEALQAFRYFSEVGQWESHFPAWERLLVVYVGAAAMYFVAKRLKKRHHLKEDVRDSFRDACFEWTEAVGSASFTAAANPTSQTCYDGILVSKRTAPPHRGTAMFPRIPTEPVT
ncbi:hypothetical protein HPB47_018916 [Ixodes persulcatus]|uniref:Uncharacterized protein n=1 Tax=Ixodes persulcatus TaxID=34615 RepID=A0AC60QJI9_IXOPE|nr:hypothetical protein HPB47_018916 [Ixodes persulcatus]